jgi:DNA-binding NtrC family response regulator
MNILIVDDEERLLEVLTVSFQFQWQDSTVLAARTAEEALHLFNDHDPDVVVLDVGLPDRSGFDVLRDIRRVSDVPIIMLTAASDEVDQMVEQLVLERGESDSRSADTDLLALEANGQLASLEIRQRADRRRKLGSTQHGLDVGQQRQPAERLDQVVICSQLESFDLVHLITGGGQHDDRHV